MNTSHDSEPVIGIDLGTTNSAVAVIDTGIPVIIPGPGGGRLLPSAVAVDEQGRTVLTGAPALRARALHPGRVFTSVKRFMGRRFAELQPEELETNHRIAPAPDGGVVFPVGNTFLRPQDISAAVLRELRTWAETYLQTSVTRAVITVPAYFNDAQRQSTKEAGGLAGLRVERIIHEPTAAALAHGLQQKRRSGKIAVFDLGGGTFDISILELHDGVFRVLATHGDTRLGGDDIDAALAAELAHLAATDSGACAADTTVTRLREAAGRAKIHLSEAAETTVELPFLKGGKHFTARITRARLEELALPVLERARAHCLHALRDAGLRGDQLDDVILVGGQTRMPLVRSLVHEWLGHEPDTSAHPDEAVALGAGIQAGMLSGQISGTTLLDVTPLSLGIETFGGLMNVLIPRNSTIPAKAGELFTNAVDGQQDMAIHILQGERELATDNWTLGRFTVPFDPAPRGTARVGVQFEIDADGILHVLARDTATGRQEVLRVESAVDVGDDRVEQMVAGSVEHAFEDMAERQRIEALQRGKRLLEIVDAALGSAGGELSESETSAVLDARARLESAISDGTAADIKRAMQALDAATKTLADLLMQRAALGE